MVIGRIPPLHKSKPEFLAFSGAMALGIGSLTISIQAYSTIQAKENYSEISFQVI
jgi:hypothetical protein